MAKPVLQGVTASIERTNGVLNSASLITPSSPDPYPAIHEYTQLPLDTVSGWHDLDALVQTDERYVTDTRIIYCDPDYVGGGNPDYLDSIFDTKIGGNGTNIKGDPFNPTIGPTSVVPYTNYITAMQQLRYGKSDILLFKSGAVISGTGGNLSKNGASGFTGASITQPAILSVYGGTTQVTFEHTNTWWNLSNIPGVTHQFWIIRDVCFHAINKDPARAELQDDIDEVLVFRFEAEVRDILVEGCTGKYTRWEFGGAPVSDPYDEGAYDSTNCTLRRSVLFESYSAILEYDGQGRLKIKKPSNLKPGWERFVLDECVLDHGGWTDDEIIPHRPRNEYSHNAYQVQERRSTSVMRGCTNSRASGNGVQWRSGADVINNLFIDNPIVGFSAKLDGKIAHNVVVGSSRCTSGNSLAGGWGLWTKVSYHARNGVEQFQHVHHNLIIHKPLTGSGYSRGSVAFADAEGAQDPEDPYNLPPAQVSNVTCEDNVTFNWSSSGPCYQMLGTNWAKTAVVRRNRFHNPTGFVIGIPSAFDADVYSFSDNQYYTPDASVHFEINGVSKTFAQWVFDTGDTTSTFSAPTFTDSSRTMATYMASIGETGGADEFCALSRLQTRANWRTDLMAKTVNAYFREGFDIDEPVA